MDYLIRNQYLGSAPNPSADPRTIYNYNIAYFCPKCGEIWGRIIVADAAKHHVLTCGCRECGPAWWGDEAGCLTHGGDTWKMPQTSLPSAAPLDLLINEFLSLLQLPTD